MYEIIASDFPIEVIVAPDIQDILVADSFYTDVLLTSEGPRGEQGLDGPPGNTAVTRVAAQILSGHRVVKTVDDCMIDYASNDAVGDADLVLGLITNTAGSGDTVTVYTGEEIEESGWNWAPGPIFLGQDGHLTQTEPSVAGGATFIRQVATSVSPTSILIDLRPSFLIS